MSALNARLTATSLLLATVLTGCGAGNSGGSDATASASESDSGAAVVAQNAETQNTATGTGAPAAQAITQPVAQPVAQQDDSSVDNSDAGTSSESLNQQFWQALDSGSSDEQEETAASNDSSHISDGTEVVSHAFPIVDTSVDTSEPLSSGDTSDADESSTSDSASESIPWWETVAVPNAPGVSDDSASDVSSGAPSAVFDGSKQVMIADRLARLNLGATIETGITVGHQTAPEYAERSHAMQPDVLPEDAILERLGR